MKFKAKKRDSALLGVGEHIVTIDSAAMSEAGASELYDDKTPQLEVVYKNAEGMQATSWLNLMGYTRKSDLSEEHLKVLAAGKLAEVGPQGYIIDVASNTRLEGESNTEAAMNIVGNIGVDC